MANTLKIFKEKLFSEITEIPRLLQPAHLVSLDGFRGISIILILVFHICMKDNWGGLFDGKFGVNIFFVVSGFIITTLLLKEKIQTKDVSLKKFYARRFLKIVPVAYIYLAVITLLNFHYKFNSTGQIVSAAVFLKNTTIISSGLDWTTGHFWSLSVEEQFYIFFPFILKENTNNYLVTILLLLLLIPVLLALEANKISIFKEESVHEFLNFFRYIIPILAGALFSVLLFKKIIPDKLYPNNLVSNLIILFAAYEMYSTQGWLYVPCCSTLFSSLLIGALIINNLSMSDNLFFKMLNTRVLSTIGIASYSIYIWQQVFLLEVPWHSAFKYADSQLLNLLGVVITSFLSYYFLERSLARFKKRFR